MINIDKKTQEKIHKRMRELSKDKEFSKKLEKEVAGLKGKKLREYASKAVELSEKEVR